MNEVRLQLVGFSVMSHIYIIRSRTWQYCPKANNTPIQTCSSNTRPWRSSIWDLNFWIWVCVPGHIVTFHTKIYHLSAAQQYFAPLINLDQWKPPSCDFEKCVLQVFVCVVVRFYHMFCISQNNAMPQQTVEIHRQFVSCDLFSMNFFYFALACRCRCR